MSRGINKVILVGNIGQDPEVRYLPNGGAVANVNLATSESWMDKSSGQRQEKTEWHRIVFFGKLADVVGQYVRKGSKLYVEGKLQTRKWQDQNGNDRYTTEIVVDGFSGQMQMLDGRSDNSGGYAGADNSGGSNMGYQGGQGGYANNPAAQPMGQPQQNHFQQAPQPSASPYQQPDYTQAAPQQPAPQQHMASHTAPQQAPSPQPAHTPPQQAAAQPVPQQQPSSGNFGSPASSPAQSFDDFDDDIPF